MTQPKTVHDLFNVFTAGYSEQIDVSEEMLGWLDWFVDVRHLWGWTINIRHGVEFRRLNEHQFHHKMAFYKL